MNYRLLFWLKFYDAQIFSFFSDIEETQATRVSNMAYELGRKGKKDQFVLQCSGHSSHYLSSLLYKKHPLSFFLPPPTPALKPCSLVNPHKLEGGRVEGIGTIKRKRNRNCILWKLF
jgi:hypothetical protein